MTPLPIDLRRIAVVCPSWVGDTVMCTPVLRAIRQHRPDARIAAIVRPGLDQLLAGCAFIDSTIVCDNKGLFGPQRLAKALKQSAAQAVVLLPNSFRSALGARIAGAPIRIGYDRDGRHALLTHALPPGKSDAPVPMVDYYLALARFALQGHAGSESTLEAPVLDAHIELTTTPDEESAADALLHDVAGPFVALNPGANRSDKRWPAERFAALADRLHSNNMRIVLTGAPSEIDLLEEITRRAKQPPVNLAQRSGLTLGSLKAVLRRARLLITNDTGPRHIALALDTPTITLFGPTDHRWTTLHDVADRERLLTAEPFLPEELTADKLAQANAIDRIPVEDVEAAARAMLAE